jgi:DNA-binding IclR family transcriptional regulator
MYNAPIIKKGIEILRLVMRANKPIGVSEIARNLSIVKSTALGVLKALEEEGFIAQDVFSKKYVPGRALYELSREALRSMEFPAVAKPFLSRLVELVDETAIVTVRDQDDTLRVLEVAEPKKELKITLPVGTRFPLYTGAMMKVFMTSMKDEEIVALVKSRPLPKYTEHSITSVEDLLAEVRRTRSQGYAVDMEEYRKGVRAIAAPVFRGLVARGAVSIFGLAASLDETRLPGMIFHLKNTADLISGRLTLMARHRGTGEGSRRGPDEKLVRGER